MTDTMRQELGERNVRVATLMPGATTSEVFDNTFNPEWRAAIQTRVGNEGAVSHRDIGRMTAFMMAKAAPHEHLGDHGTPEHRRHRVSGSGR